MIQAIGVFLKVQAFIKVVEKREAHIAYRRRQKLEKKEKHLESMLEKNKHLAVEYICVHLRQRYSSNDLFIPDSFLNFLRKNGSKNAFWDLLYLFWTTYSEKKRVSILEAMRENLPGSCFSIYVKMLDLPEPIIRSTVLEIMVSHWKSNALHHVRYFFNNDQSEIIQAQTTALLGELEDFSSFPRIVENLNRRPNSEIQRLCIEALIKIDKKSSMPILYQYITSNSWDKSVITKAIEYLTSLKYKPVLIFNAITSLLYTHPGDYIEENCMENLFKIDADKTRPILLSLLKPGLNDTLAVNTALTLLTTLKEKKILQIVRKFIVNLNNNSYYSDKRKIVFTALNSVKVLGSKTDVKYIIPLLSFFDKNVRLAAVDVLTTLGAKEWQSQVKGDDEDFLRLALLNHQGAFRVIFSKLTNYQAATRIKFGHMMKKLADENPSIVLSHWSEIAKLINRKLENYHTDYNRGYQASDCCHTDSHIDVGIGIIFPDNPPSMLSTEPTEF